MVGLVGCSSAERHLAKARRQIAKAEALGATWSHDTVYQDVPVITEQVVRDTVFMDRIFKDTLVLTNNRVTVKVKIDTVHKNVYLHADVKPDTVIKRVPVVVNNSIKAESRFPWWAVLLSFVVGIVLAGYLFKAFKSS
jgi:hypothetical protein